MLSRLISVAGMVLPNIFYADKLEGLYEWPTLSGCISEKLNLRTHWRILMQFDMYFTHLKQSSDLNLLISCNQ
jgi:hypothetical protein